MVAAICASLLTVTLTGTQAHAAVQVAWPTFGFDAQRDGFNLLESGLGPTSVPTLVQRWATPITPTGWAVTTQPVVARGVRVGPVRVADLVFVGTEGGTLTAIDLQTGEVEWRRLLPTTKPGPGRGCEYPNLRFGINGTPVVERARGRIYVAAGDARVYALDLATGRTVKGWPIAVGSPAGEHVWSALTLWRGALYASVASYCDVPPYTGKVVGIDVNRARRFAIWRPTHHGKHRPYPPGGGVWGWGGVSVDRADGDVYAATGNAAGKQQNYGYSERVVRLGRHLNVKQSNFPFSRLLLIDQDFGSTPMLYRSKGCPPQLTALNKDGELFVYRRGRISGGPFQRLLVATPRDDGESSLLGVTAYDSSRRMVYVSSPSDSPDHRYHRGLIAFHVESDCHLTVAWQASIGSKGLTSSPVVADGVVYVGTGQAGQVRAVDASDGKPLAILPFGTPVLAAPTVVNGSLLAVGYNGVLHSYRPLLPAAPLP